LLFIMRDSIMPTKVHISLFSFSVGIITESFCFPLWKVAPINHYTTLNFPAFRPSKAEDKPRLRSFRILFKWQKFVYILIMTEQHSCLPMKSCMPWLECYCVTHLILHYLIIRYINYSQVPFNFVLLCVYRLPHTRLRKD
jgi:hypothetical protein